MAQQMIRLLFKEQCRMAADAVRVVLDPQSRVQWSTFHMVSACTSKKMLSTEPDTIVCMSDNR